MRLREACDRYRPAAIFLLLSGGYDSLATAHVAYQTVLNHTVGLFPGSDSQPLIKVVHINTGIGIPETRKSRAADSLVAWMAPCRIHDAHQVRGHRDQAWLSRPGRAPLPVHPT